MAIRVHEIDERIITWARKLFVPVARAAFFIVFFYFGFLKLAGLSPASPLAEGLTAQTIGSEWFQLAFIILAIIECLIGLLFLVPQLTRIVIPLLFVHLVIVSSPLLLVPAYVWEAPLIPNLEGQYIIKNIALVAVAIGIAASTPPLKKK